MDSFDECKGRNQILRRRMIQDEEGPFTILLSLHYRANLDKRIGNSYNA